MDEFKEIIGLRNSGKSQAEIANRLGRSRRTVIRYLKSGKLPIYKREQGQKKDPLLGFTERIKNLFQLDVRGKMPSCGLVYQTLKREGYSGSLRTVERKTQETRHQLKQREIYFEQAVDFGQMMEGDFTEFAVPFSWGKEKRFLWVMAGKRSKATFAASFGNQTFESFAEGSVSGFGFFGGVPKIYRLDNLSPVVQKIVKHGRHLTHRFNELAAHYGFKPSFCNPGAGHEKGTVEALNKHFKNFLAFEIARSESVFASDDEFKKFLRSKLAQFNEGKLLAEETRSLAPLPLESFPAFRVELALVNKYGFVHVAGKRYSVPENVRYQRLEVRLYSDRLELFAQGKCIKVHLRNTSSKENTTIDFRDHLHDLLKKPGAFTHYKHQAAFFPGDSFRRFFERYPFNKNYLKILSLCRTFSIKEVADALDTCLSQKISPDAFPDVPDEKQIQDLMEGDLATMNPGYSPLPESTQIFWDPLLPDLTPYDQLIADERRTA